MKVGNNMTHTKGPWNLSNPKTRIIGIKPAPEAPDESGNRLAQVTFSYTPTSFDYPACQIELEANASLIAAAPELLSICESLVDLQGKCASGFPLSENEMRDWAILNHKMREAVNKAKGVI
jgi:hypothetical protein